MPKLPKLEEQILLAVWKLGDGAYAIPIREYLIGVTGENISIGSTYVPLDRLVRKGLLETWQSDPLPERGGMSRRYYKITKEGVTWLKQARQVQDTLWDGLPKLSFSEGQGK